MLIQKYLSSIGLYSRRQAEKLIKEGKIKVNNITVEKPYTQIDPQKDILSIENKIIKPILKEKVYIALYKPKNVLTSKKRFYENEKIIYDFLPKKYLNLGYAGRLDKDSEGLVVLSNDGDFLNKLAHPRYQHTKEYEVILNKAINNNQINILKKGIFIQDKKGNKIKTLPAEIYQIKPNILKIILKEGKNRQIRKMFKSIGFEVINLKRTKINDINLDGLKPGQWKFINIKK